MWKIRQHKGTGFLGFPIFINPSLGLYICGIDSGVRTSSFLHNLAEFFQVLEQKIRQFFSFEQKPKFFSSSSSKSRFCITLIDSVNTNSDLKENGPHHKCQRTENGSEDHGIAIENRSFSWIEKLERKAPDSTSNSRQF